MYSNSLFAKIKSKNFLGLYCTFQHTISHEICVTFCTKYLLFFLLFFKNTNWNKSTRKMQKIITSPCIYQGEILSNFEKKIYTYFAYPKKRCICNLIFVSCEKSLGSIETTDPLKASLLLLKINWTLCTVFLWFFKTNPYFSKHRWK